MGWIAAFGYWLLISTTSLLAAAAGAIGVALLHASFRRCFAAAFACIIAVEIAAVLNSARRR